MSLLPGFQKTLIRSHLEAADWQEAIRLVGASLVDHGYVQAEYLDAVIEREGCCATGLPTKPLGVAIPHADGEYVHKTAIAVGVFPRPVKFQTMGAPDQVTEAAIVFMIAMREPEKQVEVLQGLTALFRNTDLLQKIHAAGSSAEIAALLNQSS